MDTIRLAGRTWERWRVELDSMAPKTRRSYLDEFKLFLEWADLDTESLYKLFIDTEYSENRLDRGTVRMKVLEYINHIDRVRIEAKGRPYSASKKRMVVNAVMSFFRACEEKLDMGGRMPKTKRTGGARICTKPQLKRLLQFVIPGNYRDISIIHMSKDSGLRIGDISNIKMGHMRKVIEDPNLEFHQFTITQAKTGEDAHPIIGPEAVESLRKWIEQRGDLESEYLYVALQDNADYQRGGKLIKGSKRGNKINGGNISRIFTQIVKRAGLTGEKISAHSLRKYHSTRTIVGGLSDSMMKTLQGKDLGDSLGPYIDFTEGELLQRYKAAYGELGVFETVTGEVERRRQSILDFARLQGYDEDKLTELKKTLTGMHTMEQLDKELKDFLKPKQSEVIVIEEDELTNHLNHGFVFLGNTPSGRCIVERK